MNNNKKGDRLARAIAEVNANRQVENNNEKGERLALAIAEANANRGTEKQTHAPQKAETEQRRSIVSAEDRRKYNDYRQVSSRERMEWQKEVREHGDGTPVKKDSTNAASRNIHGIQTSSAGASNENSIQGVKITAEPDHAEEEKKRRKQSVKAIKQEEARMREIGRQLEAEDKYYQMSPDAQKQLDYIIEAEEESDAQKWAGILSAFAGISGGTNAIAASSAMSNAQNAKDKLRQEYGMTDADIDTMALIHKRMKSAEAAEKRNSKARKFADAHEATASGVSIPASVFGGLLGIAGIGDSYLDVQKGKALGLGDIGLDTNDKYNTFRSYSGSIRDEVKQNNNWMIGKYDAFDFLYDTGMSGLDSLAASAFGSVGGAIALGAGAATDTAMDLAARGVSSEKAIAGGIAAGTFETLFEKVSLGNLRAFKEVSAKSAKDVAKNMVKTTFVNASEEFTTEVANIVYDYVANGNLSNAQLMMQELTSQGMDEDAAKKEVFKRLGLQAVEAGAGGALMGFAFGAGGTAYNQAARANYTRAIGREIKHSGDAGSTIAEGKAAPQGSAAYEAAVKAEKRAARHDGKFGDYSVGKSALENADIYMQAAAEIDGRFKNYESAAELKESYDALKQTTRSKKELQTLNKEYKSANALLETRETAKQMRAAADDFAQKKLDARTKVEMTNPEIEVDGEKKTVERIDKVNRETGEITVKTTSGESVPLSTASVTDKRAAKLYEAAKDYSTEEAQLFVGNYSNDVDIKYYKKAFDWFRNMGRAGADVEQARKLDNAWGSYFTPEAQEQIVKAGAVNREFRQGVTDLSLVDSKNNRQYKLEKQVLEGMTKAFNTEIIIVDSYTNSKGEATNGFYMRDKNRIVIARNADGNLLLRTAGHELYHHVENYAAEQAQQLSDYVISALKEKGVDIDKALEKYGSSYAEDKHVSELVADSMFDVFMDEKFVRRFTAKYSSLSGKIISRLREIVSNMKNTLKVLATNGRHVEISALSDDVEKLETIRQMLVDGAKRAGENFAAKQAENKKTAESAVESGEDYSIKNTRNMEYAEQIGKVASKKLGVHDSLCLGKIEIDARSGIDSTKLFIMNQSDYRKSTRERKSDSSRSAHGVPTKVMKQLPSLISDAVMFIQRGDGGATVITNKPATDENGRATFYVAGIVKNGSVDGETVNIVKSVYPLADLASKLSYAAEKGVLVVTDKSKANDMMARIGIQYSEGTSIISLAKDSIAQTGDDVNNNFSLKDSDEEKGELIVPDNIGDELRSALEEAGVTVAEYVAGDEQSRLERLNEDEDVMFSKKEHDPDLAYYGEVITENRIFRQIYASLGDLYSGVREDIHLDNKDIDRVSRKILKQTHSGYSSTQLSKELTAVYDYMSSAKQTGNFDEDLVLDRLVGIARKVIEKSTSIDSELWEQYADAREWLKKTTLYISPELKAEIASNYGDYRTYRNLLFKKANLNTQDSHAMALDEAWGQLHELAPEYFPTDISDKDMPMQLAAFFDAIKKRSVNPYEQTAMSIEEEATLLASQLFSEYFNVGTLKSDKEKYRGLVYNNMQATKELRSELRREFNRRNAQNREDYRKEYVNRVAEFKKAKESKERRNVMTNGIERTYKYLSRRLNNETDYVHIPEELKPLARAYTQMLPASRQQEFNREGMLNLLNVYSGLANNSKYEMMIDESFVSDVNRFIERNLDGEGARARYRDLSEVDLQILGDFGDRVKYIVDAENKAFAERNKTTISAIAQSLHSNLKNQPDSIDQELPEDHGMLDTLRSNIYKYQSRLMNPQYLFESINGEKGAFAQLYKNLRNGENIQAEIISEGRRKVQEIKAKNHYDETWAKRKVTIDAFDRTGSKVKLEIKTERAMELYAELKRGQGFEHITDGGFVISQKEEGGNSDAKRQSKNPIKKWLDSRISRDRYWLPPEKELETLSNALTADQRNYADDLVMYITNDIGALRNEISLKLYGIKKYRETYYIPIKSDENFIDKQIGRTEAQPTIRNQSSSKRTKKHAGNPVVISGLTNTVIRHIYDSSLYCAYVLPLADIKRVYNYREEAPDGDGKTVFGGEWSVRNDIMTKRGKSAVDQIESFLTAVDSGQSSNSIQIAQSLTSKAKKVAVMANLSVVVQQPTAVFRAMLYVDPKYFANVASKADIAEMKKWNGCALIKEIGYFDVNMGRNAINYINEYSADKNVRAERSTTEKVTIAKEKAMPKIDELSGWAAGKADEITWGCIWNACKKQTAVQNKGLSGDKLNAKAAELFQDVIGKTQVYDSVFTKCDLLRSKDGLTKMFMQFMSEPTTSLNMLYEAVSNAKKPGASKEAKAKCGRALACYVTSLLVNSAAKSVIYTMRDDDEDKSFWEKYLANFVDGVASEPIGMFPFVKDVVNVLQGYDASRLDMAAFTSLADAVKMLGSDNVETKDKVFSLVKTLGLLTGVPAYNVLRDGYALLNVFKNAQKCFKGEGQPTTATGVLEAIKANTSKSDSPYRQLYDAKNNGDVAHYQKVYGNLRRGGNIYGQRHRDSVDTSTINTQVRQVIKDEYMADEIDRTTALQRLREWPGKNDKADAAEKRIAAWDEEKQAKKSEKS